MSRAKRRSRPPLAGLVRLAVPWLAAAVGLAVLAAAGPAMAAGYGTGVFSAPGPASGPASGQGPYGLAAPGGAGTAPPSATDPYDLAQNQLQALDTSSIQGFVQQIDRQLQPYGASLSWPDLMQMVRQRRLSWDPAALGRALLRTFGAEVAANLSLLGRLLALVVLAAVLHHIQSAFGDDAVGRVADAVVFLALGAMVLAGFLLAGRVAVGAVDGLVAFMMAELPLLLGLLAASGSFASAGLLHPLIIAAVNGVGVAVRTWVLPLVFLAAILDMVSSFAPTFRLTSLAALMRQVGLGLLGLLLVAFIGVAAIEGAAGVIADGVGLRTAKYAAKAFVPVVGGIFADAVDLVVSSGFLVRSGLGLAGLVIVGFLVVLPLIKLIALWGAYRLAAAVAQPVGGEGVGQLLGGVASTLSLLCVILAAVGVLCFVALAALVGASGASLMLR